MKHLATRILCGSPLVRLLVPCLLMLAAANAGSAAQYNLIHAFTGPPSDGQYSANDSLTTDGSVLYGFTQAGGTNQFGTLFKVNTNGYGYQVLYSFTGNPNGGSEPIGRPLLLGGAIYGMTEFGGSGTNNFGTVFKINTDGTGFQLLHTFNIIQNGFITDAGEYPYGSLVSDGTNLFGMTASGTQQGEGGEVFVISTNGTGYTILHVFDGLNDGLYPNGSLALSDGVLYGMTERGGGTNNAGAIFRVNTDGSSYQIIHIFGSGFNDGANPYGSLVISGSTLYGMSYYGGSNGVGAVFGLQTDGSNFQLLHSFAIPELWEPLGELTFSNSTLYGMADNFSTGGIRNNGVVASGGVFQLNADGTGYQILHAFSFSTTTNATDADDPEEDSLLMLGGKLYGMTLGGGNSSSKGALFSLDLGANIAGLTVNILPAAAVSAGAKWQIDGGPLLNSGVMLTNLSPGSHTLSFTPVAGWKTAPNQIAVVSLGTTNIITATYTDPALTILTPTSKEFVSNGVFTATGTTSDNVPITGVYCQLNAGPWSAASTADNWTNWSATNLTLTPGTNVFSAYAMDSSSNVSATNTVSFTYIPCTQLSVIVNGFGAVTPNLNQVLLPLGKIVSLAAKAGKGCAFVNWTGSTNTSSAKITLVVAPDLVFNANFRDITRPVDAILSPKKNQIVSNSAPVATGKASDNAGVTAVWFQVDGGDWMAADNPNGTNWTTPTLTPFLLAGPNTLKAYAQDGAGNNSLTNSVAFKYLVQPGADWAPDSLNGLLAAVTPTDGPAESVGFDLATFAQSGVSGDANADDYGAGTYSYVKTDTNMAQLSLTTTNPPGSSNNLGPVTLVFTNHYAGYFTNDDAESGGFDASIATNLIPATVAAKTITATSSQNGKVSTIKLSTSTFVKTPANNSNTGTSSGNYTFTRYSPVGGIFAFAFTDAADAGETAYVQTTFTNATSGTYYLTVFDNVGTLQNTDNGQFTSK